MKKNIETPTEVSLRLSKYQEVLAKDVLPLEYYRLYHLDTGELKKLEEVYFLHYQSFMTYIVSLDGFQLDGHLVRINTIHGKYQSVLSSINKALKRRENAKNLESNRILSKKFWRERIQ